MSITPMIDNVMSKVAEEEIPSEMREHFEKRTRKHINLVRKYCGRMAERIALLRPLIERGKVHDDSKFGANELLPYVWLTWRYKCQDDETECKLPGGMEEKINKATEHHILNNSHHPEYHQGRKDNLLNKNDRDAIPDKLIDARTMPPLDVAEMVADWCAMSEERGNTPREWADKTVNKRWRFTPEQKKLIYSLIDIVWSPQ